WVVGALRLVIWRTRVARFAPMGERAMKNAAAASTRSDARTAAGILAIPRVARAPAAEPPFLPRRRKSPHAIIPAPRPSHAPRDSVAAMTTTEIVPTNAHSARSAPLRARRAGHNTR